MSHLATAAAPNHRRRMPAEAIVSAYIHEIARSGRRQRRAATAPPHTVTVPTPSASPLLIAGRRH